MIEYILNPQTTEALGWTLLHSLWQGAAFSLSLVILLIALRKYSAQSRYIVSAGLLSAFFLTVSITFWDHWKEANLNAEIQFGQLENYHKKPSPLLNSEMDNSFGSSEEKAAVLQEQDFNLQESDWTMTFKNYYKDHLPLLVTLWLLGVLILQLRFLGQLAYVQRLKYHGTQMFPKSWSDKIEELEGKLRIQKKVKYLTSIRVQCPMVIGWLKPVVLLPRHLFKSLSETEIYAVLAHELAHIRREDFIINLLQTFLCNVFFFHPGIWWMSNRIDDEREHCCDDLAVAATGPATSYAKTLINVSEIGLRIQKNPELAIAFSGKNKKRDRGGFGGRIRRLFISNSGTGSFKEGFATACILISALIIGIGATVPSIQKEHDEKLNDEMVINEVKEASNTPNHERIKYLKTLPKTSIIKTITSESGSHQSDHPVSPNKRLDHILHSAKAKPAENGITQNNSTSLQEISIEDAMMACQNGDLEIVQSFVRRGGAIDQIGPKGFTALMTACSYNQYEIVDYLIDEGADLNLSNNGWTALIEAADEGSFESMEILLKAGADVNYYWNDGNPTAISMAASEGNLNCLELLMNFGADINGKASSIPPLHKASEEGKIKIVNFLLTNNVLVNKRDYGGHTALMYAASEGKKEIVLKLLAAGADKSIKDNFGYTAKEYAEDEEQFDLVDLLDIHEKSQIHKLTELGLMEKVEQIVAQGVDVNYRDSYGRTALHIASAKNRNIDMQILIDLGANINVQDNQGRTPLMYAAADGNGNAMALLISKNADTTIADVDGMRAFEWACTNGNRDLAKFVGLTPDDLNRKEKCVASKNKKCNSNEESMQLLQRDIQKEKEREFKNEMKRKELFHIHSNGYHLKQFDIETTLDDLFDIIRHESVGELNQLLSTGISVDVSDDTGQSALMIAARENRLDMAAYLIEHGADVNMSSFSGLTALHYAALENHDNMARLLLDNNAHVDPLMRYSSTDGNFSKESIISEYIGATPLLIAVEANNPEVLRVLFNAGANINQYLTRNEYILKDDRKSYLTASEVMGLDSNFLKNVQIKTTDDTWTPYKQALLLNHSTTLQILSKK